MTTQHDIYGSEEQPRRYRARSYDDLDAYVQNRDNERRRRAASEQQRYSRSDRFAEYDDGSQEPFTERQPQRYRARSYDELDAYVQDYLDEQERMRSQQAQHQRSAARVSADRSHPRGHFDEEGRIESVYRPTRNRSRYDRNSNRYTSANAANRREGRREVRNDAPVRQAATRGNQQQAGAARYSRDRYMRQEGQHHAMPVSQQSYTAANRAKPVNPKILMILGGIAALLLVIIVGRFVVFGGTASAYNELKTKIDQEQTQLTELESANSEMETQMELWQHTIDVYNQSKK